MIHSNQNNINFNVSTIFAGIGGQGVILATQLFTDILIKKNLSTKQSEIHGLSQRGGSVCSHIRFGKIVYSPVIPKNKVDYILAFDKLEAHFYLSQSPKAKLVELNKNEIKAISLKSLNIALLVKFLCQINRESSIKNNLNIKQSDNFFKLIEIKDIIKKLLKPINVKTNLETIDFIWNSNQ